MLDTAEGRVGQDQVRRMLLPCFLTQCSYSSGVEHFNFKELLYHLIILPQVTEIKVTSVFSMAEVFLQDFFLMLENMIC